MALGKGELGILVGELGRGPGAAAPATCHEVAVQAACLRQLVECLMRFGEFLNRVLVPAEGFQNAVIEIPGLSVATGAVEGFTL